MGRSQWGKRVRLGIYRHNERTLFIPREQMRQIHAAAAAAPAPASRTALIRAVAGHHNSDQRYPAGQAWLDEWLWLGKPLPADVCEYVRAEAASYGWGAVPVCARIGGTEWETSLLPREGGYVLPVKKAVRLAEGLEEGGDAKVRLALV